MTRYKFQPSAKNNHEAFYDIYLLMGHDRSLPRLRSVLANLGLAMTLNTLKNYSARHEWQQRLQAASTSAQAQKQEKDTATLISMNERQAGLGELSQRLAAHYLTQTFSQVLADPSAVQGTSQDIARLMEAGSRLERLARGEVTNRTEARVQAYSVMVSQISEVFVNVARVYDLPPDAVEDFTRGADAVVHNALTEGAREEIGGSDTYNVSQSS
jgi:hypothetical protein